MTVRSFKQPATVARLGRRLAGVAASAASVALLIAMVVQLLVELPLQRSAAGAHLRTLATVLAANSARAAEEQDSVTATRMLASLRNEREVEQTLLLGPDGRIIASFSAAGHIQSEGVLGERDGWLQNALTRREATLRYTGLTRAEVVSPVLDDEQLQGYVYLSYSLVPLRDRLLGYLAVMALAATLAVFCAWCFAQRLQGRLTRPLTSLHMAIETIARDGDFSRRAAVADGGDSTALLDAFNSFIAQAEARVADLQRAGQSLQAQLEARERGADESNTRLRATDARLHEAERQARAAAESRDELLRNLLSSLRMPLLTAVRMSEQLREQPLDAALQRIAELNIDSVESTLDLYNRLHDVVRQTGIRLPLEEAPFDAGQVLEEVAALYAKRAHDKSCELLVEVDPALHRLVRGDAHALRLVLMNLLSNAIKFTTRGTITARLKLLGEKQGILGLRFEIIDTGIGMRAETRPSVEDTGRVQMRQQSGQGLALARALVDSMSGRLALDSEFGRGSTFTIDLTLAETGERSLALSEPAVEGGLRLLLADDHAGSREQLRAQLLGMGCDVTIAVDGESALSLFDRAARSGVPFDAVLVDWQMPGMDGIELLRRLRNCDHGARTPLILLGSMSQLLEQRALDPLAPLVRIAKPVRHSALRWTLAQLPDLDASIDATSDELTSLGVYRLLARA